MRRDDKTTSNKIKKKLERHGICVSTSTVRRARKQQGWTLQWTAYCQLICDANKKSTGGVLPRRVLTLTELKTCGIGSSSTWSPRSSQRTSRSWWMELRSSGRGKSRRKNVTSILTTFCRRLFQLWWRLKEQRQNIKNDRFRCQHALPCRMLI